MSNPIRKIYVNSRYKTSDSVSDSNFKFELPFVINTSYTAKFYITDVCIPNLFKTISKDENDKFYFETIARINGIFTTSSVRVEHTITMPPGNYTELGFCQALDQQLHNISNIYIYMGCAYDSDNNICNITTWSHDHQHRNGSQSVKITTYPQYIYIYIYISRLII